MKRLLIITALAVYTSIRIFAQTVFTDVLTLANNASEKTHQLTAVQSRITPGGLNEQSRLLLPLEPVSWQGGHLSFVMKVDPAKQNYITVRLWGSDVNHNRLYLVCEGKQIGYRHLGDIDMLDIGSDGPFYNERFFYNTSPLPLSITKGKKQVAIKICSQGSTWGYGQTWDKYQRDMTTPSRGLYKVYTHTDGAFVPPANEKQGVAPKASVRTSPGVEVLDQLKARLNKEIDNLLSNTKALSQVQMQFLAKAYRVPWSRAYKNAKLEGKVLQSLDSIYVAYKRSPRLAEADPATYNAEWFGLGITGQVLHLLFEQFQSKLDNEIEDGTGNKITRRNAYTDMLVVCRNWHQRNRRMYTNQSMINDLYGIYYANKGLQKINPSKAMPEKEILRYLYESLGMQPWLGSDLDNGPSRSAGDHYMQLTKKGLTKELGFVGNYGEVIDWVAEIYEATRPAPDAPGDAAIKAQVEKIALARAPFRYVMLDDDKHAAMRMETVVGWRDTHYPGDVTYAQRPSWDGTPLQIVAVTLHPQLVGFAQQMFADNQFFSSLEKSMREKSFRVTAGLLHVPEQYELVKAQPPAKYKLPMTWDQPDFVFSDEEDGVIAIKNGKEIFYASSYWRARYAINNLARVHAITPSYDRIATIRIKEKFDSSGLFYTRRDWTNFGFGNGGIKYPDSLHSAHAGEQLPVAKIPAGTPYRLGDENAYAGRADYYELQYGRYLIAMNASSNKTFELIIPAGFATALDLQTRKFLRGTRSVKVAPLTTVVLYKK